MTEEPESFRAQALQPVRVDGDDDVHDPTSTLGYPIIALCASAGGLGSFEAFLKSLPLEGLPEAAYVVVQHLAPDRPSMLVGLLQRHTRFPVVEIHDGMPVAANRVHVIPPDCELVLEAGVFRTGPFSSPRPLRHPIDNFLRSLAWSQGETAVVAVLSGTGADGSVGIESIKQRGGVVLAQDPDEAECSGMPQSAIATGLVDFVLPAEKMVEKIFALLGGVGGLAPERGPTQEEELALGSILEILQNRTGHDFTQYKGGTVHRRVVRRMTVHQIQDLSEYARLLESSSTEASALFRELLIGVTRFFRDPEVFRILGEKVIPALFSERPANAPLRVWVPGCATGEEAYGIAILVAEYQEAMNLEGRVQVYATDIDSRAIAFARAGIYPASIEADVSRERLDRFFTTRSSDGAYRIQKRIREMLIFSEQNLTKDPPFSRMDLVSCRNLLIYLGGDLQRRLIAMFHTALNPSGFLVLGSSEHVGDHANFFSAVDRGAKIYTRLETTRRSVIGTGGRFFPTVYRHTPPSTPPSTTWRASTLREYTEKALLVHAVPTAILLNADGDILYLHGRAGRFLELPPDAPGTVNALRMAREGLRSPLSKSLRKAISENAPIRTVGLRIRLESGDIRATLTVRPLAPQESTSSASGAPGAAGTQTLFLAVIDEVPEAVEVGAGAILHDPSSLSEGDFRLADLLHELEMKDEHLQASREALETSNEDLTASNEELQSINEELQSANEELETSKEELQSVYEELTTVNAELQAKLSDLSRANNDMLNLLEGTGIATIFVDRSLRIMRFTPEATRIVNLIATDVGRPIGHILSNLANYGSLVDDAAGVLRTLAIFVRDVQTRDGAWFALRIQPYRTQEGAIEGAVITFADVTERKRMEAELKEHESRLRAVVENYPEPIYLKDAECRLLVANQATLDVVGRPIEEVRGRTDREFYDDQVLAEAILENDRHVLTTGETLVREERVPSAEGERVFLSTKAPWRNEVGDIVGLVGLSRDVTESYRMSRALEESSAMFRSLVETLPLAIFVSTGIEQTAGYLNPRFTEMFGYVLEEVPDVAHWWPLAYPDPAYRAEIAREWDRRVADALRTGGAIAPMETDVTCKDGTCKRILWQFYSLGGRNYACGQDLTEIRRGEEALQRSIQEKDALLQELHRRESEAQAAADELRVVMESMPAFTFVSRDPECRLIESSSLAVERMRIAPQIGGTPDIPHDRKPRIYKVFKDGAELLPSEFPLRRAMRENAPVIDEEIQIVFPDGELLHLFGSAVPLLDAKGTVRGGVGAFIDISPQKRGEEELRRSRAEMELVLDNTAEAIAYLDLDRRLVWANRAYLHSVAGTPENPAKLEAIRGKRCVDVWRLPKFCDDCPVEKCMGTCEVEEAILTPGSQKGWDDTFGSWQVRAAPVRAADGKVVGTIEVARSIAERLQLEGKVRQAEKLAAVGQLAGGVAHNFNNQLTGIMGYADLLLLKDLQPDARPLLEGIKKAAGRAAQLTGQLLAFARKGNYQRVPMDVERIILETIDLLRQTVDPRIQVDHQFDAPGCRVIGDPSQLQNALLNLGLNARDAMPQGGILRFSTSVLAPEPEEAGRQGKVLRILVQDSGMGMSPQILERVFEPFFTTKPVGQGTGLGLASVHGTVTSMGGTIEVFSEEGRGSLFVMQLPLADDPNPAPSAETSPVRSSGDQHILLIDDEAIVLETCSAMLGLLGYKVTSFTDPAEALAFHAEHRTEIDLVILDLVMPKMGGRETLAALRSISPDVQVVISSGYSLDGSRPTAAEGVAAYLQKPFNMADLSRIIASVAGGKSR